MTPTRTAYVEALFVVAGRFGSSGAMYVLLANLAHQEFGREWEVRMVRDVIDLRRAHQRLSEVVDLEDVLYPRKEYQR